MKIYYLLLILISIFVLLAFNNDLSADCAIKCYGTKKSCVRTCDINAKAADTKTCESSCVSTLEGCKTKCEANSDCLKGCNDKLDALEDSCTEILTTQEKYNKEHLTADKYSPKTKEGCQDQYDKTPATLSTFSSIELTARDKMTSCLSNADAEMVNCKADQQDKVLGKDNRT